MGLVTLKELNKGQNVQLLATIQIFKGDQPHKMLNPCLLCQDRNFEVLPYQISITKTECHAKILRLET